MIIHMMLASVSAILIYYVIDKYIENNDEYHYCINISI